MKIKHFKLKQCNGEGYYYNKLKDRITKNSVFIESMQGIKLTGEPYWTAIYILEKYDDIKVSISINNSNNVRALFDKYGNRVNYVKRGTEKYWDKLATSEYLINDTTFPLIFIKRKEQTYINTWHGTPYKTLGIDEINPNDIANIQNNFKVADFIISNNSWNSKILSNAYMMNETIPKKILNGSMNKINSELMNSIDFELGDRDKKIVVLAYTWIDEWRNNPKLFYDFVLDLDKRIGSFKNKEKFKFRLSVHYILSKKAFFNWFNSNIKNMDIILAGEDLYSVINKSDIVVTDFSSVMFDAAFLNKRVILDQKDIESYRRDRGLYDQVENDLPFERTTIENDLLKLIGSNTEINYKEFNIKYNDYQNIEENWFDKVLKGEEIGKNNSRTLIYPGTLKMNGITTTFHSTIEDMLKRGEKITIWIPKNYIRQETAIKIQKRYQDQDVEVLHSSKPCGGSVFNYLLHKMNLRWNKLWFFKKRYSNLFKYEAMRILGNEKFDKFIHFSGYEWYVHSVMKNSNDIEKIIFVHNDMIKEYKNKKNFKRKQVYESYDYADKIIFVSEYLMKHSSSFEPFKRNSEKLGYRNNVLSTELVDEKLKVNIDDIDFGMNCISYEEIEIIKNKNIPKFLTIGRLSKEKNQLFTVEAFDEYKRKYGDNSVLILVGSYASKKSKGFNNKLKKLLSSSEYKKDIIVLSSINNPYVLYKHSNLFLLPSKHEGYPTVTMEAAYSGLYSLTSDLPGLKEQEDKLEILTTTEMDVDKFVFLMRELLEKNFVFNKDKFNEYLDKISKQKI